MIAQVLNRLRPGASLLSSEEQPGDGRHRRYRIAWRETDGTRREGLLERLRGQNRFDPALEWENIDRLKAQLAAQGGERMLFRPPEELRGRDENALWRLLLMPAEARVVLPGPRRLGEALGRWHAAMADLDLERIHSLFPRWRDGWRRYDALLMDAQKNPADRLDEVVPQLDWLMGKKAQCCLFSDRDGTPRFPVRAALGGAAIAALRFAEVQGGCDIAVNVSGVMPGCLLRDFADGVRQSAADAGRLDLERFAACCEGFLMPTSRLLTEEERAHLTDACLAVVLERTVWLLDDYLLGSPAHVKQSAQEQWSEILTGIDLIGDLEQKQPEMRRIVEEGLKRFG